ncbi:MAG: hypothetical protein P8Q42_02150 [Flavobacteriales bacterium]|nr:hypothetical protein [Flavobacteriales bacterium]
MKYFIVLISALLSMSCTENIEFSESFGGSDFDEGYDIDLTPEGDIILTGVFSKEFFYRGDALLKSKGSYDIFVCKIDTSGEIKWANSIGEKRKDWVYNSSLDKDGNIYTCGYTKIKNQNFPIIFKLDKNGEKLWEKVLPTKGEFTNLMVTKENILITGINQKSNIYKMSFDGELTVLSQDSSFNGRGILQNKNHQIIAYGSSKQEASVICLNQELKKTNEVSFGTKGNDIILSLIKHENYFHVCGQIEGDTLFWEKDTTIQKTPLNSKGGKDGFYAILDTMFNLVHFEIQTSPKNDWSMNLAYSSLGEILLSTIISNNGNINGNLLQNQKGNFDIALSTIKNQRITSTKLISSIKEEGVNKIIVQDSLLYFSGWHQGNLKLTDKIKLNDNGKGNAFLIKVKKNKFFEN